MRTTSFFSFVRALLLATASLAAACDSSSSSDAGTDSSSTSDASTCEARSQAFDDFVAAHRSCAIESDCAIVGDCGPNADFTAVRADSASEARALQVARCGGAYDGPMYRAVCQAGTCVREATGASCGLDSGVGDGG